MGGLFGGPKLPEPQYRPPPTPADPAVEAARAAELRHNRRLRGAASTLLTGSAEGDATAPSAARKVLLGT